MADPIQLKIQVGQPLNLKLTVKDRIYIIPDPQLEPLFIAWKADTFSYGAKATGVDAGSLWQMSIDDDYLYVCVVAGAIGVAEWRKTLLFKT